MTYLIVWTICGLLISYLTTKFVLKRKYISKRIYALGVLGAIFISLLFNILGIKYGLVSLGNILVACIGGFIAIFAAKKQI